MNPAMKKMKPCKNVVYRHPIISSRFQLQWFRNLYRYPSQLFLAWPIRKLRSVQNSNFPSVPTVRRPKQSVSHTVSFLLKQFCWNYDRYYRSWKINNQNRFKTMSRLTFMSQKLVPSYETVRSTKTMRGSKWSNTFPLIVQHKHHFI